MLALSQRAIPEREPLGREGRSSKNDQIGKQIYLFCQKEKRSKSELDAKENWISSLCPFSCVLPVSLNLEAWIGVLALPVHRYMTGGKFFFTSLSLSLLVCKLGITAPVSRVTVAVKEDNICRELGLALAALQVLSHVDEIKSNRGPAIMLLGIYPNELKI